MSSTWSEAPIVNLFRGHGRPIQVLAVSADGQRLASAAGNADEPAELLIWEVRTGRLVQPISGHGSEVTALTFSPDGKSLVSVGRDGLVKAWDVTKQGAWQQPAEVRPAHVIAYSGDGAWLAAAGGEAARPGAVVLLNAVTGVVHRRLPAPDGARTLAVSHEGDLVAFAGSGDIVRLVRPATSSEQDSLAMGMKGVACIAFSPDGQTLAVAGTGTGVKLWDVPTAQERCLIAPAQRRQAPARCLRERRPAARLRQRDADGPPLWYSVRPSE